MMLPRGKPIKEKVNAAGVDLPRVFERLQIRRFCGYLRFDVEKGVGVAVFERGRLIGVFFEDARTRFRGLDALARIFAQILRAEAEFSIYRLSSPLSRKVQALLNGRALARRKDVARIDFEAILKRLKSSRLTGCLRIFTDEQVVLIFYREGEAQGFFHDGEQDLSLTADPSRSVARLPGAKVDLLAFEEIKNAPDILASADLSLLWRRSKELVRARREKSGEEPDRTRLLETLLSTVGRYFGPAAAALAEKEFQQIFPPGTPWSKKSMMRYYEQLVHSLGPASKESELQEMMKEIQRQVKTLVPWDGVGGA